MNHIRKISILFVIFIIVACDNDDDKLPPSPDIPLITLIAPADNADGVDIGPTFKWSANSENTVGLSYDFYIGEDSVNVTLEGETLSTSEFQLEDFKLKKRHKLCMACNC
ncbi:hypothetical protein ACU8V7_03250 [Zobellia nedashkovskayae]